MATIKKSAVSKKTTKRKTAPTKTYPSEFYYSEGDFFDTPYEGAFRTLADLKEFASKESEGGEQMTVWEVRKVGTYKINRSVIIEEVK
jgi:hypothetical protein